MKRLPEEVTRSYADSIAGCATQEEFDELMAEYGAKLATHNARRDMKFIVNAGQLSMATRVLVDYAESFVAEDDVGGSGAWLVTANLGGRVNPDEKSEMTKRLRQIGADMLD